MTMAGAGSAQVEAVRAANQAFYTAIESGDLDAMGSLWLDGPASASITCIHPGNAPVTGRSEVLRSFAAVMVGTPYIQFILTDVRIAVIRDVAVVTCTENVLTPGTERGAVFSAGRAVATNVFLRVDDRWLVWQHHGSPIIEPRRSPE
ncbi:MAG: nuclear transport factor 2 family protein [Actinomycetota bacterium]|jgi:ketosteroid isomerase-like protein|nr:nuclear transport factor 2 family protein [Actinomycetota bacterium]MDQ3449467.1 nuclear transport factor 2 family protein [Actinomycetota bacterium]